MQAVLLRRHGGPSVMRLSEVASPAPQRGHVRVRLAAAGVNYAEVLSRKGLYGWAPPLPYILGMEGCGVIDAVGDGVDPARVGERVIAGTQYGCYAEQVCLPEARALAALPSYSTEENAAFAVNYVTAWVALVGMARARPGDRVLVQAASGGVGTAAVQIAKRLGCTVYAAAGSDSKLELARRLGADHAVNYRTGDFERELRAATGGRGVDVVLELVGGEVFRKSLRLLAPFGRMVVAGFASLDLRKWNPLSWWRTWRDMPRVQVRPMAVGSYGVLATHVGYLLDDPPRVAAVWRELTDFVERHGLRPVVGATFALADVAQAHAHMESRASVGKIVLRV